MPSGHAYFPLRYPFLCDTVTTLIRQNPADSQYRCFCELFTQQHSIGAQFFHYKHFHTFPKQTASYLDLLFTW